MLSSLIEGYKKDLYFGLELGQEGYESLSESKKVKLFNAIDETYFYMTLLDKDFEDLSAVLGESYFPLIEMFMHVLNDTATAKAAEWS